MQPEVKVAQYLALLLRRAEGKEGLNRKSLLGCMLDWMLNLAIQRGLLIICQSGKIWHNAQKKACFGLIL